MAIEGTLEEFRLPEILQMVAQQQKTGILTVQGESTIVAVSFLTGRVVAADSLEETVEERLGEVLVAEGLLDRETFSQVSQRQRRGEGRLIDLLVAGEHLSRDEILATLRRQTEALLHALLDWSSGEFKFYGNDEVSYEEGFEPIRVDELLLSALPEEDEAQPEPAATYPRAVPDSATGEAEATAEEPAEAASEPASWQDREVGPGGASVADWTGGEPVLAPLEAPARPTLVRAETAPVARPAARPAAAPAGFIPLLAGGLAAALVAALLLAPGRILLPLPWQRAERASMQAVQRQAVFQSIDHATKTFFLLDGRFPDDLSRLVDLSLLARWELRDPSGARLLYTPLEERYEIGPSPVGGGEMPEGAARVEAITGNFLLDPEFLANFEGGDRAPLVLLD